MIAGFCKRCHAFGNARKSGTLDAGEDLLNVNVVEVALKPTVHSFDHLAHVELFSPKPEEAAVFVNVMA
jgi:hypothetical protein